MNGEHHNSSNKECPWNDPETFCNPATSGLPCSCEKQETQSDTERRQKLLEEVVETLYVFRFISEKDNDTVDYIDELIERLKEELG